MKSATGTVTAIALCLALSYGCGAPNSSTTDNTTTDSATADNVTADSSTADSAPNNVKVLPLNTTEGTTAKEVIAEVKEFNGREGIHLTVVPDHVPIEDGGCDNCTFLLVDEEPFKDGVIELKISGQPSEGAPIASRGFVGVVFRVNESLTEYEGFYLRTLNAAEEEPVRSYTTQYFSYPDHPWPLLREEFPGKYESYADVAPGEWIDLRIEVSGATATFFVNDEQVLNVDEMFHGADFAGGFGLFTEPETDAYFSDLTITYDN